MGGGPSIPSIPGLSTWDPNDKERDCRCAGCDVILVCELVANMGQNTYAFLKQALGSETFTESGNVGIGEGADGPEVKAEIGGSVSIVKGEWLITYLRKEGSKHMCTDCFRKTFPKDFQGILLTSVGKAKVINSQYEWYKKTYGN